MAKRPPQSCPTAIALLGKLPDEQRAYLDACVAVAGGKLVPQDSAASLGKFVSEHGHGQAVVLLAIKNDIAGVIRILMQLRRMDARLPVVLLTGNGGQRFLPLWRELGVHPVEDRELRGTGLADVLRAALADVGAPAPGLAPALTGDEQGVNLEELAGNLNERMRCGAGKGQVFLHAFVRGSGQKTPARITLRCPLRSEIGLHDYVYYEHIRGVCCGAAEGCAVLRAYTAMKDQPISAYLRECNNQEPTMNDHAHAPSADAGCCEAAPGARPQSVTHARPRRGLMETDNFLLAVAKLGASDLHLKTGAKPRVRVGGVLRTLDLDVLPNEEFEERLFEFLSPEQQRQLMDDGSVDLAYDVPNSERLKRLPAAHLGRKRHKTSSRMNPVRRLAFHTARQSAGAGVNWLALERCHTARHRGNAKRKLLYPRPLGETRSATIRVARPVLCLCSHGCDERPLGGPASRVAGQIRRLKNENMARLVDGPGRSRCAVGGHSWRMPRLAAGSGVGAGRHLGTGPKRTFELTASALVPHVRFQRRPHSGEVRFR
ncbi:MAG: hypothetical protein IPM18_12455 [Phycisphaerales bacterium]|nr:hypothetical protein [Phycisphaerales bacterium]